MTLAATSRAQQSSSIPTNRSQMSRRKPSNNRARRYESSSDSDDEEEVLSTTSTQRHRQHSSRTHTEKEDHELLLSQTSTASTTSAALLLLAEEGTEEEKLHHLDQTGILNEIAGSQSLLSQELLHHPENSANTLSSASPKHAYRPVGDEYEMEEERSPSLKREATTERTKQMLMADAGTNSQQQEEEELRQLFSKEELLPIKQSSRLSFSSSSPPSSSEHSPLKQMIQRTHWMDNKNSILEISPDNEEGDDQLQNLYRFNSTGGYSQSQQLSQFSTISACDLIMDAAQALAERDGEISPFENRSPAARSLVTGESTETTHDEGAMIPLNVKSWTGVVTLDPRWESPPQQTRTGNSSSFSIRSRVRSAKSADKANKESCSDDNKSKMDIQKSLETKGIKHEDGWKTRTRVGCANVEIRERRGSESDDDDNNMPSNNSLLLLANEDDDSSVVNGVVDHRNRGTNRKRSLDVVSSAGFARASAKRAKQDTKEHKTKKKKPSPTRMAELEVDREARSSIGSGDSRSIESKRTPTPCLRRSKSQKEAELAETNYMAKRAATLAAQTLVSPDVAKQLLLSMALTRENPRSGPETLPKSGLVIEEGFFWGQFPPLEQVLRSHMTEYYELSTTKCQSRDQQAFNNKLVFLVRAEALDHGWEFDSKLDDKKLRDRVRCFFKTHVQNAKKRLKTMVKNPTKKANAKALALHMDLIEKYNRKKLIRERSEANGNENNNNNRDDESQFDTCMEDQVMESEGCICKEEEEGNDTKAVEKDTKRQKSTLKIEDNESVDDDDIVDDNDHPNGDNEAHDVAQQVIALGFACLSQDAQVVGA